MAVLFSNNLKLIVVLLFKIVRGINTFSCFASLPVPTIYCDMTQS